MKHYLLLSFFSLLAFAGIANTSSLLDFDRDGSEEPTSLETLESSTETVAANVTFCVDLACFAVSDAVAVAFGYQGFAPVNGLSDPDGDRVYCGTFSVPDGEQEFKFFFAQEQFENLSMETGPCVNSSGNRTITVQDGVPQTVLYGWESCEDNCPAPTTTDITFCVDLSCFLAADAVAVAGTFNGFNPGANFLADPDGDGTYCGTVGVPAGEQEFIYFFAQEQFETLTPGDPCTVTNFGFTNRSITVVEGVPQTVTYGWETCEPNCEAPSTADITFCVNLDCFPVADAVAVAGTFNGFNPGINFLSDPDGDGTYCGTVSVPEGPQEFIYFFAQEQFENLNQGDPCTVTNFGFTNRSLTVEAGVPQTITAGWESCDETCIPPAQVTFCVNLNCSGLDPSSVNIFGQFNGFNPFANPMDDSDGDGIYCTTIPLAAGNQEYLFLADGVAESFSVGDPCTVSCCGGQFTNRVISVVDGQDQMVTFDWESCDATCPFPVPWSQVPGGVGCSGGSDSGYDADTETFTIESTNCFSFNYASDSEAYIKNDLCGNGEIIARVNSINPFGGGWAGISMRESEAPGSKKIALSTNLTNFARRVVRMTTNGYAVPQQFFRPGASWLRLVRTGNQFIGYMSVNGTTWQQVMAANINMSSCIQVGMFVTNSTGSTVTATFDNVSVSGNSLLTSAGTINEPASELALQDLSVLPNEEIANELVNADFLIVPNPASNVVYLDLKEYYGMEAQIQLLNTQGHTIQTRQIKEVGSNAERFDVNGLANGMYLFQVRTDQGSTSKRFLKVE